MSPSRFLKALKVDAFLKLLDEIPGVQDRTEPISVADAAGRVLGRDVISTIDVPSFPKSAVDGYALKASATFESNEGRPLLCRVIGSVEMGSPPDAIISTKEECIYVPTGGFIPQGADAIVKIEFTKSVQNEDTIADSIQVYQAVVPGDGVILAGADIHNGSTILTKGTFLTPAKLGILSAAGITSIEVYERLRCGLFSSGNEITEPGEPLSPGHIYDVNSVMIQALLQGAGCVVTSYGFVLDDKLIVSDIFSKALVENDVVICSGGTSKGTGDLMPEVIENHPSTSLHVHGIRIKPGKPLIFAIVEGKPVFVLPGNPVSAFITMIRLAIPHLRRWNRLPHLQSTIVKCQLAERVYSEIGRLELKPVIIQHDAEGEAIAFPVTKGSETITTLADAQGYFEIPENVEIVEKGTIIDVILF